MNPRSTVCTIIAAVLLFAGCSSISVTSDYDPAADFSKLKTYQWMHSKGAKDALTDDPLLGKQVEACVNKALEAKGYTLAQSGTPDFYVAAHAGVQERINVTDYGYAYGAYWGPYGGYGGPYGGYGIRSDVMFYEEATLLIDIAQKVGDKVELIWRGAGAGTVDDRPAEQRARRVDEATMKILKSFPPEK